MTSIHNSHDQEASQRPDMTEGASPSTPPARASLAPSPDLVLLLAIGAGLAVASLYYSQPMLGILAADIQDLVDVEGFDADIAEKVRAAAEAAFERENGKAAE